MESKNDSSESQRPSPKPDAVLSNQAPALTPAEGQPIRRSRASAPGPLEGHPIADADFWLNIPQPSKAPSKISGFVGDTGDSFQLQGTDPQGPRSNTADLAHTGAHLSILDNNVSPPSLPDNLDTDTFIPLGDEIQKAMEVAAGDDDLQFLPLDKLCALITVSNISSELERAEVPGDIQEIVSKVLEPVHPGTRELTTRRKIFVLLCLVDQPQQILHFIEKGIYDSDLPFEFSRDPKTVKSRSGALIDLFDDWKFADKFTFERLQGQVVSAYFKFSFDRSFSFGKYVLPSCIVLPFLENAHEQSVFGGRMIGGTSEVRKVQIHPAHYDHNESATPKSTTYYAIKELRHVQSSESGGNRETYAYRRLNPKHHPHIVRLLATYEHKSHLHLIFPWADGNLYQFWKIHYPEMHSLPRGISLAKWLIHQFVGLAQAMVCIHDLGLNQDKKHGRHGDVKPENILWFRDIFKTGSIESLGTLQISDLGSADFHNSVSQNVPAHTVGHYTDTYRAPEFDKKSDVSPRADIWSFGCVLMEFIVWYAGGGEAVIDFVQARTDDSNLLVKNDQFFDYHQKDDSVSVKRSVLKQFLELRNRATSDFIFDVAAFLESHVLLAKASDRANCRELERKFTEIERRCNDTDGYCTRRTNRSFVRSSTDGSNKVPVGLSSEQKTYYARNMRVPSSPPSMSIAPSADETTGGDDASVGTWGERTDDMPNSKAPPSTTSAQQVSMNNEPIAGSDNLNITNAAPPPIQQRHSPLRERFRSWARRMISGCFMFNDV